MSWSCMHNLLKLYTMYIYVCMHTSTHTCHMGCYQLPPMHSKALVMVHIQSVVTSLSFLLTELPPNYLYRYILMSVSESVVVHIYRVVHVAPINRISVYKVGYLYNTVCNCGIQSSKIRLSIYKQVHTLKKYIFECCCI